MTTHHRSKWAVCAVAAGVMATVSATSHAGRAIRADASDGAFEFLGGFWGDDNRQFGGPSFDVGKTEFKLRLNPNHPARYYNVCMGEGFIKLIAVNAACAAGDFASPPTANYIAVFAADFDDLNGSFIRTRGFVDPKPNPYRLGQAIPAMRFWWNGVTLASDATLTPFDVQVVLLDRSNGSNNGNFDIEFNYGQGGGDAVPPIPSAEGFQGFSFGPNRSGPTFGPFGPFDTNGAPIRFCFRGGKKRACN